LYNPDPENRRLVLIDFNNAVLDDMGWNGSENESKEEVQRKFVQHQKFGDESMLTTMLGKITGEIRLAEWRVANGW